MMIGMHSHWLGCKALVHVRSAELIFPVTGHSYMPPDRVFGVIEKDIKKKDTIVQPQEYLYIFSQHGTVVKLSSEDCPVYDWKTVTERAILKPGRWHFRFLPSKRFIVFRFNSGAIKIRGETAYRSDLCVLRSVFKNNQSHDTMWPDIVAPGIPIKTAKLNDVRNLLKKHFGNEWQNIPELEFFKNLTDPPEKEEREEEIQCQHVQEDEDLRI